MGLIKGITIKLYEKTQTGTDGFNHPIYKETPVDIENVLVAPASTDDILAQNNLSGKEAVYSLAIPKGDTHDWENRTVEFFGKKWETIGVPLEGIEKLIPLGWNKKVTVKRYGQKSES
jgi:hypothetical protein